MHIIVAPVMIFISGEFAPRENDICAILRKSAPDFSDEQIANCHEYYCAAFANLRVMPIVNRYLTGIYVGSTEKFDRTLMIAVSITNVYSSEAMIIEQHRMSRAIFRSYIGGDRRDINMSINQLFAALILVSIVQYTREGDIVDANFTQKLDRELA